MQRTRTAMLIAVLASLLAAGCSTVVPGQAAPAPAPAGARAPSAAPEDATVPVSPEDVAWADALCGAFLDTNRVLTDQPNPDVSDVPGTISSYSQYFSRTVPALDAAIVAFDTIGPGTVNGGVVLVARMSTLVTLLRDAHTSARAAVDAIDPASPTALTQEMPAALALTNVQASAPQIDIAATPELNAAAQAAPNCQAFGS